MNIKKISVVVFLSFSPLYCAFIDYNYYEMGVHAIPSSQHIWNENFRVDYGLRKTPINYAAPCDVEGCRPVGNCRRKSRARSVACAAAYKKDYAEDIKYFRSKRRCCYP